MPEWILPYLKKNGYTKDAPFDFNVYKASGLLNAPTCSKPPKDMRDDLCPILEYHKHLPLMEHFVTYVPDSEPFYKLPDVTCDKPSTQTYVNDENTKKVPVELLDTACMHNNTLCSR
jgi:hypothetical protein